MADVAGPPPAGRVAAFVSSSLTVPVRWFVDDVTAALHELRGTTDDSDDGPRRDATTEAFNLTCGFIDADGLHTDDELWALTAAFGPLLPTQLGAATPADVRKAGLVANAKHNVASLSPMFELLVQADAKNRTRHSHAYYRAALELAFAVAAVDAHTSTTELSVIGDFQSRLLDAISTAGLPKPGDPDSEPEPEPEAAASSAPPPAKKAEPELPKARSLDDLMAELDGLVGLAEVKREVRLTTDLTRVEQIRRQRGLPVLEHSRHVVFTGNPGTGKTTVARLLAQIYRTLGVVTKGHLVETDRSQLVAGYVGQTAFKCAKGLRRRRRRGPAHRRGVRTARGGSKRLPSRAGGVRHHREALVEDRRDRIIVIVAGYPRRDGLGRSTPTSGRALALPDHDRLPRPTRPT